MRRTPRAAAASRAADPPAAGSTVMFRREAACEIIRSGTSSSTLTTRAAISGSLRSRSPDRAQQRHLRLDRHLGELRQRLDDRVEVAAVVHGHRHADLGRRHHVHGRRKRSNTSNTRRRKPYAISMRVEVMSTTVTSRLAASAGQRRRRPATASAVMSVPSPSGLRELRMRTGMLRSTAGRIVLGCSTFAPK